MPNSFDENGLQVKSQSELVNELTTDFQNIYGEDINVDSNSPDGQIINIFAQALYDEYEMLTQIFSSFDPDQAIGKVLDQRCAINGIQRKGGTYTYVTVQITTDRSVTLPGLDENDVEDAYTVADSEGNQFVLVETTNLGANVTEGLSFRAVNVGNVEVLPNTITVPVTVILGVTNINNASVASSEGINEETDAELRERRKRSVSIASQGFTDGLVAGLLNIPDVTQAEVYNNRTNVTDADGIPGHSIWVIVEGGSANDIGQVMNNKVPGGVGMKGTQYVRVAQVTGRVETYYYDRPTDQLLYVNVVITPYNGQEIDTDLIKSRLVESMKFKINQTVTSSEITCVLQEIQSNAAFTVQVSTDNATWTDLVTPGAKDRQFYITDASITVTVNQ